MPGVAVLPNSPGLGGFGTAHSSSKWMPPTSDGDKRPTAITSALQNGVTRFHEDMLVSEVKAKARDAVQKEARGASAISLIRIARAQLLSAKDFESKGDLKSALGSFIKAASLTKMTMDSSEFAQERAGKGGVLRQELNHFLENDGRDLTARTNAVEEKLKALEKAQPTQNGAERSDVTSKKPGLTIAERLKSLQDNGLPVATSKRFPRDIANLPTPPLSPSHFVSGGQFPPSSSLVHVAPLPSGPSAHTFVSPASLGPPSPSSSPSSSPQINNFDLAGFTQAFPSIDEIDELPAFALPSVPTGVSNQTSAKDMRNGEPPLVSFKNFTMPIERPSSTPITPINNAFNSRPASPTKMTKPFNLSGNQLPSISNTPLASRPLPVTNTAFPKELLGYIRDYKVLVIDVRNREDFDEEHIKADAVVCVEPSVLLRENVTAAMLEDSMVIAPKHESSLFANRDKFDLVAVYDYTSKTFGGNESPLSILVRVMYEQAFRKSLKRMPMMLVGGLEAWKNDLAGAELTKGDTTRTDVRKSSPLSESYSLLSHSSTTNSTPLTPSISSSGSSNLIAPNGIMKSLSAAGVSSEYDNHQLWTPPAPAGSITTNGITQHHPTYSLDQSSRHSRSPADATYSGSHPVPERPLSRKPAIVKLGSNTISHTRSMTENVISPTISQPSFFNSSSSPITYPQFPRRISPTPSGSGSQIPPSNIYDIASPPQASINPSQASRRRSDFVDQSQEALFGLQTRHPIDYPELSSPQILRPPPVAASSTLERQDNRPRVQQASSFSPSGPKPPRIASDYPVTFWSDIQIGISGLKNLGNTCYMNAPIQCLSATVPFARFFTDGRWKSAINFTNPLGSKGKLAGAFAKLLHEMWGGDLPYLTPIDFRRSICQLKSQYNGSDQHDSQEFLSFLIDGIHEDLNRIIVKPTWTPTPEEEAELERLPPQIASEREWKAWRARNDSLIVDFFQGQFRNRLECLTCHKTSTTYNVFSILQLPIPHSRSGKVPIERCLDAFFNEEVLEKDDAWDCPRCKTKRRASKRLSLARLPPILLIHLKRFEANGRFSDKIDTFVDFPLKSLDLTNYMPPPLPPGADKSQLNGGLPMSPDDPRSQLPPYRYDLYGVTNHFGNLSSGHYTASIASRGGWMYCDDSSVKPIDSKQVVGQKAYVLFYKRVQP